MMIQIKIIMMKAETCFDKTSGVIL